MVPSRSTGTRAATARDAGRSVAISGISEGPRDTGLEYGFMIRSDQGHSSVTPPGSKSGWGCRPAVFMASLAARYGAGLGQVDRQAGK